MTITLGEKVMSLIFRDQKNRPVYWENTNDESQRFWMAHILIEKEKSLLIRKWGKIGNKGQSVEQLFDDLYEAEKVLDKLIYYKEAKGYRAKF